MSKTQPTLQSAQSDDEVEFLNQRGGSNSPQILKEPKPLKAVKSFTADFKMKYNERDIIKLCALQPQYLGKVLNPKDEKLAPLSDSD